MSPRIRKTEKLACVLVVDDDDEWREFVCGSLSPTYCTRVATNGVDALHMARHSPPALILLDVMMPGGMDGFRSLCELRKDPVTCDIPVIILTEVNAATGLDFSPREMKNYLGAAPEAMLEKPVEAERLLAEIKRVLRGSRREGA